MEGEREGENIDVRNIDQLPFTHTLTGDQTHNPSTFPDQGSNWKPFALQDDAQPTEPHRSGTN